MVIGSRYVKGGKTNDAFTSIVMSHMLNFAFRIRTGLQAKDLVHRLSDVPYPSVEKVDLNVRTTMCWRKY